MKNPHQLIEQLPKTDLHCHFDGSIRIATLIELARKNKVVLPSFEPEILMERMKYGRVRKSLEEYLMGFDPLIAVLQEADDIERAFFEVCEDAAQENVWHLELRYCPLFLTKKGLTPKEVVKSCLKASERAEKEFNMSVKHILCGMRNDPHDLTMEVAMLASKFRDQGVVGFDIAGPEKGYPFKDHMKAIYWVKRNHLFITLHAGESAGPESIKEALFEAGAHRIGHGTSLVQDPDLLNFIIDHRIGVEACPISNWHTGAVKSLDDHPIKKLLEDGVRVSINTDNRLCSDTTVTKELMVMIEQLHMSMSSIKRLLENGFKSAFLPYRERGSLLEKFDLEWCRLVG